MILKTTKGKDQIASVRVTSGIYYKDYESQKGQYTFSTIYQRSLRVYNR